MQLRDSEAPTDWTQNIEKKKRLYLEEAPLFLYKTEIPFLLNYKNGHRFIINMIINDTLIQYYIRLYYHLLAETCQ